MILSSLNRIKLLGSPFFLSTLAMGCLFYYVDQPRFWEVRSLGSEENSQVPPNYLGQVLKPRLVKKFLGLRIAAADLVWIDLAVKADTVHEKSDESGLYQSLDAMLQLDPLNFFGAWYGAIYLSVIKDDIGGASKLFETAIERLKQNPWVPGKLRGAIYFAYGYHLLFEERRFEQAAIMIKASAELPEASPLSKDLAKSLSTERGQLNVGFRVLNDALLRVKTPGEKTAIEAKMRKLLVRKEVLDLESGFHSYLERSSAEHLPKKVLFKQYLRSINNSGRNQEGKRFMVRETENASSGSTVQIDLEEDSFHGK